MDVFRIIEVARVIFVVIFRKPSCLLDHHTDKVVYGRCVSEVCV
jgi:hypothetical protein